MLPVLSSQQIREADQYTILNEPISSLDLMERASLSFVDKLLVLIPGFEKVYIICGTGNNGGDGLAVSRILSLKGIQVATYVVGDLRNATPDFQINYERLNGQVKALENVSHLPKVGSSDLLIDAIFGSGLSRSVSGFIGEIIEAMNQLHATKVALDIASGLFANHPPDPEAVVFKPDFTISFQVPKWSFFQPSLYQYVGHVEIVDIGLNVDFIKNLATSTYLTDPADVSGVFNHRPKFSHKGNFGRLLIIGGSKGKMGAALLATQAALRSGAGLVFVNAPACGLHILQTQAKEAMVIPTEDTDHIQSIPNLTGYDVIGIGPGLGLNVATATAFDQLLETIEKGQQLIIDADALNLLANHPHWLSRLPAHSILTPHPGELKRLVGDWKNDLEKENKLRELAQKYRLNVVSKGAFSAVVNSKGDLYYNPTGNPGMATGGSGDVLTGIIAGLASTGMTPFEALKAGVYVHGLAGDLAKEEFGERSLIAGDLIQYLPSAFKQVSL